MKIILVLYSYHHMNTEKVAKVMAEVLDGQIKTPDQVDPKELQDYDLVGFGGGIYGEKHHESLLDIADRLLKVEYKKAFIFSTSAIMGKDKVAQDHKTLREKLKSKGYIILDEFACKGFNTNSFLKHFGGMNKGRPNAQDLQNAREFAENLKKKLSD
jgi:flavodoxin